MSALYHSFDLDSDDDCVFHRPQSSYWNRYDNFRRMVKLKINRALECYRHSLEETVDVCHICPESADKLEELAWRMKGSAGDYVELLGEKMLAWLPYCFTAKNHNNQTVLSLKSRGALKKIIIALQWWEDKELLGHDVDISILLANHAFRQRARRQFVGVPWRFWPTPAQSVTPLQRRGQAPRRGAIV